MSKTFLIASNYCNKKGLAFLRKKIQVDEIFVHSNYTSNGSKENDIALLKLGKNFFVCLREPHKILSLVSSSLS